MDKLATLAEKIYFLLLVIFFFFIIFINNFIQGNIGVGKNIIIREEHIESFFIIIIFIIGYIIFKLYKQEIAKQKEHANGIKNRLDDAFKYIGQVNVQIKAVKEALSGLKKFPEKKSDLKNIINFLVEKVLAIVNSDWALLRIIDLEDGHILREKSIARGEAVLFKHNINSQKLINKEPIGEYSVVTTEQKNLGLKAFIVLPIKTLNKEQRILIEAIAQELEMIFLIFDSKYYKRNKNED